MRPLHKSPLFYFALLYFNLMVFFVGIYNLPYANGFGWRTNSKLSYFINSRLEWDSLIPLMLASVSLSIGVCVLLAAIAGSKAADQSGSH